MADDNAKKGTTRDDKGKFVNGHHVGRPQGSKNHNGLNAVLNMLKELVSKEDNLEKIKVAMQKALNEQPLGFYYKFIMPLFPKNVDIDLGAEITYIISKDFVPEDEKK